MVLKAPPSSYRTLTTSCYNATDSHISIVFPTMKTVFTRSNAFSEVLLFDGLSGFMSGSISYLKRFILSICMCFLYPIINGIIRYLKADVKKFYLKKVTVE